MDIKRYGESGVHTAEGTVAGGRAAALSKEREKQQEDYAAAKSKIHAASSSSVIHVSAKFTSTTSDSAEQEFKKRTSGLVSAKEYSDALRLLKGTKNINQGDVDVNEGEKKRKLSSAEGEEDEEATLKKKEEEKEKKEKKMKSSLSFDVDEEEEGEEEQDRKPSLFLLTKKLKCPHADTSFLPDRERDRQKEEEKEKFRVEWLAEQEKIKEELVNIIYSYHDGSGHRRSITVKKGTSISTFLYKVKQQLEPDFKELKNVGSETLMYIKEDLIIPHHFSFYDLIATKARGKSGPLFRFDINEDIRLVLDARIEKDESHPGKIVERRWYDKNKHIFPASRWERYDPSVKHDETYTVK